jgi:hypothetical protein
LSQLDAHGHLRFQALQHRGLHRDAIADFSDCTYVLQLLYRLAKLDRHLAKICCGFATCRRQGA